MAQRVKNLPAMQETSFNRYKTAQRRCVMSSESHSSRVMSPRLHECSACVLCAQSPWITVYTGTRQQGPSLTVFMDSVAEKLPAVSSVSHEKLMCVHGLFYFSQFVLVKVFCPMGLKTVEGEDNDEARHVLANERIVNCKVQNFKTCFCTCGRRGQTRVS